MEEQDVKALKARDLLLIPNLREARLIAGEQGLDRDITRANVMEVPDIIDWVRPGEFLMTTGYPFRDHPDALADLIPRLYDKGLAALGIKTKRFIQEVPESVIQVAQQYGLPLIELPIDTTFSDVVREVIERILVKETRQLSILQSRIQKIARGLLLGGGLFQFVQSLEEAVRNPVVLLHSDNQYTLSAGVEKLLFAIDQPIEWGRFRDDASIGSSSLAFHGQQLKVYITAVPDRQRVNALLLLIDVSGQSGMIDNLTMDRAGELVGFEIFNCEARKEIEARYIDQFLQDWIAGRMFTTSDIRLRAEACGMMLEEKDKYRIGIVHFPGTKRSVVELKRMVAGIRGRHSISYRCTILDDHLVILLPVNKAISSLVMEWMKLVEHILPGAQVVLCFGGVADSVKEVPQSYVQAQRTLELSKLQWGKAGNVSGKNVVYYDDLGVYLLVYMLPESMELERFKKKFLYPLRDYDSKHHSMLIPTLRAYYCNSGNMRAAADQLFTHYNTIAYRLDRVQEVLGLPLNSETNLQLQIALKLDDITVYER